MSLLCTKPFTSLRVTCTGDVFLCCYQRVNGVGNLLRQSLADIWEGETVRQIRQDLENQRLHRLCDVEGCPVRLGQSAFYGGTSIRDWPTFLEIDLPNTHCNIGGTAPGDANPACVMCARSGPGYEFQQENFLPLILPKLQFLMPHLEYLHIQGIAESFWKREMFHTLDLLGFDQKKHSATVATYTNGWLLDPALAEEFLERCPKSSITFSLDAASNDTYEKIRTKPLLPLVLGNLHAYSRLRKKYPLARLYIHNVLSTINLHEAKEMLELAREAGVDQVSFGPVIGDHNRHIAPSRENSEEFKKTERMLRLEAEKMRMGLYITQPLAADFG
jgi:hypothetical protein